MEKRKTASARLQFVRTLGYAFGTIILLIAFLLIGVLVKTTFAKSFVVISWKAAHPPVSDTLLGFYVYNGTKLIAIIDDPNIREIQTKEYVEGQANFFYVTAFDYSSNESLPLECAYFYKKTEYFLIGLKLLMDIKNIK